MSGAYEPGLVSVIVPTFNRAALLDQALNSVRDQTYRPVELLVVDDGSTDETPQIVDKWRAAHADKKHLQLLYLPQQQSGAPAARNLGLIESRGEFIQFLDSDDLLHAEKLSIHVHHLQDNPDVDLAYSGTGIFRSEPDWNAPAASGQPIPDGNLLACFLMGGMWNTMSGLYRRRACVAIGPWDEHVLIYQDVDYNVRFLLANLQVAYVDGVLSLVRDHTDDRITPVKRSEEVLRCMLQLTQDWERWIREDHRMEPAVEWALSHRRFTVSMNALRLGLPALAREVAATGTGLAPNPATAYKARLGRGLVALPDWMSVPLARLMFTILGIKRLKRHRVRSCGTGVAGQPPGTDGG